MTEQTYTTYLPQDRRRALARGSALPERAEGAALFADISGFTPLTEALTEALGSHRGIEELTAQINRVYDALIVEVERFGGSVVSFAGDAMMCWFDEGSWESGVGSWGIDAAPARAVACALALQRAMGRFAAIELPQGGTVTLGLKAAVASGPVRRFAVGEPAIQTLDALAGATVARTAAGEHLSQKGEVVADAATITALGAAALISEWRVDEQTSAQFAVLAGFLLPDLELQVETAPADSQSPIADIQSPLFRAWVLPAVYERLREGLGEFLTELRPAVALFLRFDGLDYDGDPQAGLKLDQFIRCVQAVLERYGGTLLQLTIGDKGSYLYAAFGAPTVHEDDARRAVAAALELRALTIDTGFLRPPQIGISQGIMRSGAYGGATRRTYGVLGDEVNLAARLMSLAAPGEVLVNRRVRERVSAAFSWEILPAVTVKGKREPVPLARLLGTSARQQEQAAAAGVLVGREAELAQLRNAIQPIIDGRFAGLLCMYGEPGMGKSRLAEELRRMLIAPPTERRTRQRGVPSASVTWFSLPADEILHQSLNPFRSFLRAYLDQDANASSAANAARADAILDSLVGFLKSKRRTASADAARQRGTLAAEITRTRSFLAALVNLHSDRSLYEQLDPKLRFENTLVALKALFLAESLRHPLVLHIEDAQWLDADSLTLLRELTRNMHGYPLAILLTSRYGDDGSALVWPVEEDTPQTLVELRALAPEGLRAVAEQTLSGAVGDQLAAFLAAKTGGNPFFTEQLALDLRDRGMLAAQSSPAVFELRPVAFAEVPDSINAVLIARLDRLAAQVKAVVQTAAVLGQEFEVLLLSTMLRDYPQLSEKLQHVERETIWTALNELRYLFRHALLRDAAYAMQLHARLRELHHLAADVLVQLHAPNLAARAAELAYHYGRAEDVPLERRYAQLAGEYAAARYANADAIAFYSRALELTPAADGPGRYTLLLAREQIEDLQGARDAQRADLAALSQLAEQLDDPMRHVEAALRQARYADVTGDYPTMIASAQRAIELAVAARDPSGEATGNLHWARALWYQGDYAEVQRRASRALEIARAATLSTLEADSLRMVGNAAVDQGEYIASQRAYMAALHIQLDQGDRKGASYTQNNLGTVEWYRGNYSAARAEYERSLTSLRELGDRYGQSLALLNLGEVAGVQGDYAGARAYYEQALRLKRETGDRYGESVVLTNLGDVATILGNWEAARASYEQALSITQALGHRQQQGWALARLGLLLHQQGAHDAALTHTEQSLALSREINDRNTQAYALTLWGYTLAEQRPDAAGAAYREALALREALAQPNLAAEASAGLARLALAAGDLHGALAHAEAILGQLNGGTLEGADEPFRVYLSCYRALQAAGDPRAGGSLAAAYALLNERANRIADTQARRAFLERVPSHRALAEEWAAAQP